MQDSATFTFLTWACKYNIVVCLNSWQLMALTHLAMWRHLAFRWCDLHHRCGQGWPSEWPHPSLCTLCWGPNLKTKSCCRKDLHNSHLMFIIFMLNFLTDAGIIPNMIKTDLNHKNQSIKLVLCSPVKITDTMTTLSELEVEQLEILFSLHTLV